MSIRRFPKGIETRSKIIAQAKCLFYQKGFKKTTIMEICKNINIATGTFAHYFKDKVELIQAIYADMSDECYNYVKKNLDENLTALQLNIIASYSYYRSVFRDNNTIVFHHEILLNEYIGDHIRNKVEYIYRSFNEEMNLGFSEEKLIIAEEADIGAQRELMLNFIHKKNYNITPNDCDAFAMISSEIMCRIFTINSTLFEDALKEADKFWKEHKFPEIKLLI